MGLNKDRIRQLRTVLGITLAWTLISMIQLLYEIAILKEYGYEYRWSNPGEFIIYFLINSMAFVFNGLIAGFIIVFFLQYYIRHRSYLFGILYGLSMYIILFFLLTCVQNYFVVTSIWNGTDPFWSAYLNGLTDYFFSFEFVRNFPFWLVVMSGTLVTLFVSDKYGPGGFKKFLMGQYFDPKIEERIFMFLDLKSSTFIAEKLGEKKYFLFLQKVWKDITPVILDTSGEIYQYVGDEIVITWSVKNGTKNANCIRCFSDIESLLSKRTVVYQDEFGAIPEFKAGLHVGKAMVGEIGVIKRDIVFSGDVLNTTARIQSMCNELNASLLFSDELLRLFPKNTLPFESIGNVQLKGKSKEVPLFTLK